ncbi:GNAT family N-acetyltransferase [Bacillus solimangrovi]|uniref:GNAT family N-acetyltransferase n=1 Tax=Bacillus solimangrovi TaxID=1305675 RepID=A0A1E5LIJ0_9BACI|nr:GNAT family N-acetyltransferase [Bacillus solimangrovi]OEH93866.1 GNAT family N-acetyltransferase [Bacillus solimangrovi]
MNVQLEIITRENWEEALALKVKQEQQNFVPTVAVSLAKVYVKPDGDNVEYIPFAIICHEQMIGFIMCAYIEDTTNMYWINGFIIDEQFQGRGYGNVALSEMANWIVNRFPKCEEIRLTVCPDNYMAKNLYKQFGFLATDQILGGEEMWYLPIKR